MRLLIPAAVSVSLVACVAEQVSTDTQDIGTHNRIAANRIAANRIAANRIAANRIAANRIAANRLTLNVTAQDLLDTADGREVLDYIVSCAIPEGITLVGTATDGTAYEFNGEIGLAPEWEDHPLTEDGAGWVSACLFSRVNNNNVAVDISMRGSSPALVTDAGERAQYTAEEGAFYGEYFQPDSVPIAMSPPWGPWYACGGRNNSSAVADQRVCATPDPANPGLTLCGFYYAGPCGNFSAVVHNRVACEDHSASGTFYDDCATQPTFITNPRDRDDDHGHHHHGDHDHVDRDGDDDGWRHGGGDHHGHDELFDEVITTFVQP